jgi:hypothetical protein
LADPLAPWPSVVIVKVVVVPPDVAMVGTGVGRVMVSIRCAFLGAPSIPSVYA